MDRPAELGELLFDIGQGEFKCRSPVRTGGPFRQNALPLKFERLPLAFPLCGFGACLCGIRWWSSGLRLLFFHGFTLPSSRHTIHFTPPGIILSEFEREHSSRNADGPVHAEGPIRFARRSSAMSFPWNRPFSMKISLVRSPATMTPAR